MPILINNYKNSLADKFLEEKRRISLFLPNKITIEHVGSSAVGIGGKNIIDILIGTSNRDEMLKIRDVLKENGYFEGHDSHDNRIFLASRKEETGEGDFHIHICPIDETSYKDFIVLRDFLRSNPTKSQEYFTKKYEFAKLAGFDRKKYRDLKSQYVSELLSEAKK